MQASRENEPNEAGLPPLACNLDALTEGERPRHRDAAWLRLSGRPGVEDFIAAQIPVAR